MKLAGHYLYLPIVLFVGVELSAAIASFFLADQCLIHFDSRYAAFSRDLPVIYWALAFGLAAFVGLTAVGLYKTKQRLAIEGVLVRVVVGLGIAAVMLAVAEFVFPTGMGGSLWATSFAICLGLLGLSRALLWPWMDHGVFQRRVMVYGAGARAASLLKLRRRSDRRGFQIIAFVPAPGDNHVLSDDRVIAPDTALTDFVREHRIDEIVVAMDDRRQGFPLGELLACKFAGVAVVDLLGFLERETGKLKVDLVNPSWLIFGEGFDPTPGIYITTRVFDFVGALLLAVITAPIMVVVALAIVVDDGFPILYRQRRVGLRGQIFTLYKFRSMTVNAEVDGKAQWANKNDSRVTRVGRVIRKLRCDELPQLFNVINGSMSLVGPRPERPEFVSQLTRRIPYYHERHCVRPGITGWAQLCYPYGSSEHDAMEKLEFDLYYIKHKSLIFDMMVLLQTAEVVFWGKGAR